MTTQATQPPEGYERLAWHTFPTQWGQWKPSKVHLAPVGEELNRRGKFGTLCGARRARFAALARSESDFRDHEQDAGLCTRCWKAAKP